MNVDGTVQVSGVTANDFTNVVAYTVTAADGSTQVYTAKITVAASSAKALTAFAFPSALNSSAGLSSDVTATIIGTEVTATVPFGTDVTALIAAFSTTGASVNVDGTIQVSGVTANDFTNVVVYTVTAADSSTQVYTAKITIAASSAKALTAFAFPSALNSSAGLSSDVTATIIGTEITATVPFGTDVTALIAAFSITGASVNVDGTIQVSGVTANDFTNVVVYTVTAADGSTQAYNLTITIAASPAKDLTAFGFPSALNGDAGITSDVIATITGTDIAATVPFGTDVTTLIAAFSTTGASVTVDGTLQISSMTANNFTNVVVYTVTAADASTQDYTVTVTVEESVTGLVTSGLEAHYDAQTLSSITADDENNLSQWADISGNNHNLVVRTNTPVYTPALINGHPGLDFTNEAGMITSDQPALANTVTVFFVVTWYPQGQPSDSGNLGFHVNRDNGWSMEQNPFTASGYPNTLHWQTDNDNSGPPGGCIITLVQGGSYILVGTLSNANGVASRTFTAVPFADPSNPQTGSCESVAQSYSPTAGPIYIGDSDIDEASNAYFGEIAYYDRVLTSSELSQNVEYLATRWARAPSVPTDGLLLRWKLDEGSGTVATDSSGNGLDGTLVGSNWLTSNCVLEACTQFVGNSSSHLELDNTVPTAGTGATFAAWVQFDPNITGGYQTIFDGPFTGCCTFRLLMDANLHPFWNAGQHADLTFTEYTFPLGQWVHVVWTIVAGGNGTIYIDGSVVVQSTAGVAGSFPDLPDMDIAGGNSFEYPANALFNDVLVYNRVLSPDEVTSLYNSY